ncbi:hypothetical protein AU184_15260 [Mycolicibacterium novocastrense]|uniref:hypothetical protein n=1 Tax=Mycolicibacterium novocastrense TaxID=59813 RepID=UPI000747A9C0|nr:hypothetical protein [Mycolicibacterium novocastrense]KUH75750.1 hypothetical protein AU183_00280 [Mycolicibacterium novocastrense]KUH78311.1 hypothetical protein AU072_10340 [Mycolicibacterium novocastrense]KUH79646.1 hypothetical protein AU184_15260 [Mycolicibacterium novocastrense]
MTAIATVGRRACAVLAAGSACLHATMLDHAETPFAAMLMAAMVAACLYCARDLWRDGRQRTWLAVALMNLAMIALHLPAAGHHHGAAPTTAPSTVMALATVVAMAEATVAAAVLYVHSRGRAVDGP